MVALSEFGFTARLAMDTRMGEDSTQWEHKEVKDPMTGDVGTLYTAQIETDLIRRYIRWDPSLKKPKEAVSEDNADYLVDVTDEEHQSYSKRRYHVVMNRLKYSTMTFNSPEMAEYDSTLVERMFANSPGAQMWIIDTETGEVLKYVEGK
ncbi:hypothetical protein [Streptomyces sp. CoH17]|uniref:hypothetical protein n=1 Tax=Streptomyces sp. CoH17 TaxID=2992806 RepID=UPI0022705296|nr:hypothetical protein [Streptomyces sp. CoH17]